ncbi:MAG: hypothetical protein AAFY01_09550 [Pseudomonadota bacterium]
MKSMIFAAVAAVLMFAGAAFADDAPGRNQPMMEMLSSSTIVFSNPTDGARVATVNEDGTFSMMMADGTVETGKVAMTDDGACFQIAKRGVESQRGTEAVCVKLTGVKAGDTVTANGEQVTFISGSMSDLPGRNQ